MFKHDSEQISEMFNGQDILFPGWLEGWNNEEDARTSLRCSIEPEME
jgi:hypothetical protein